MSVRIGCGAGFAGDRIDAAEDLANGGALETGLPLSVFGKPMLAAHLNAAIRAFAKSLAWKGADDPLILDLDGDGNETGSLSQSSAFFDMVGDGFAGKTAWVDAANDNRVAKMRRTK
jgi:hypothetical protein